MPGELAVCPYVYTTPKEREKYLEDSSVANWKLNSGVVTRLPPYYNFDRSAIY